MKELETTIINQMPKLEFYKWYGIKSDDILNFLKLLINNQKFTSIFYLELSNDYKSFRKLKIKN